MRRIILSAIFVFGVVFLAMSQANQVEVASGNPSSMAKFNWEKTTHNFGKIPQGKPVTVDFTFTNDGKTPLVISNVKGSCGCTVTKYSKEPVAPGKTGFVKATFNAAAMGAFNKSVRVTANVEGGNETLFIKGEVIK
ncbi:MAG: DUF1573 domain-containing protein [Cytophagales bacterium]|nr:DUF1573 domain-containing protein [Cytophagales bacterium]